MITQAQIQEILAEYADGLAQGNVRAEEVLAKYQVEAGSDLEALLLLAQALEGVLVRVYPSAEFAEQLRRDLLGMENTLAILDSLRQLRLSNRQIAAGVGGLTVAAGVIWWVRRAGIDLLMRRNATEARSEPVLAS